MNGLLAIALLVSSAPGAGLSRLDCKDGPLVAYSVLQGLRDEMNECPPSRLENSIITVDRNYRISVLDLDDRMAALDRKFEKFVELLWQSHAWEELNPSSNEDQINDGAISVGGCSFGDTVRLQRYADNLDVVESCTKSGKWRKHRAH